MNKIKKRIISIILTLVTIFSITPVSVVFAAEPSYYGGQGYALYEDYPVYSSKNWSQRIGTIYQNEGYTILARDLGYEWVEYSTSSGTKRGYVQLPNDEYGYFLTGLASIKTSSNLYYGNSSNGKYQVSGSVSAGEIVTILAKNDDWAYVEYNTTAGRKRGYILYDKLNVYNRPGVLPDFHNWNTGGAPYHISTRRTVYSGPSTRYATVGYVEEEIVTCFEYEYICYDSDDIQGALYIEYTVNGTNQIKSGFIMP